jgi:hypothetical protein
MQLFCLSERGIERFNCRSVFITGRTLRKRAGFGSIFEQDFYNRARWIGASYLK